ncbi:MAG: O-antigen ligase family protein [Candidatus Spechtbacterales bacterium]|nr:O-antigen ligase family protein [Candidatus Spechtbacterales bacterium]
MKKYLTPINLIFSLALLITILVVFAIIPRAVAFLVFALYGGYMILTPTRKGIQLFLRSIPFFIALPFTESFDNFNMWRLLLVILFIKWLLEDEKWKEWLYAARLNFKEKSWKKSLVGWFKQNKVEGIGVIFLFIAGLSMLVGQGVQLSLDMGFASVKRFIFLLNAIFLFLMVRSHIKEDKEAFYDFSKNFTYSGLLAVFFGYIQFISAYFQPAWVFHHWWGFVVSEGFYGKEWANTVTNFGNTWFSYSGNTLRLRMFSSFPDSHSFPMYVIMTLPGLIIMLRDKFLKKNISKIFNLQNLFIFGFIFVINLALVLSGTRGIWLASLSGLVVVGLFKFMKVPKKFVSMILILVLLFLAVFPAYFAIVSFPQFQYTDFTSAASADRIRSVVDFGETSNKLRIYIWKETLESIVGHPFLGVGIGNYPQVLNEPISAARAGASAHNLYLHIASTIGIPGLIVFLWFIWELVFRSIDYIKEKGYTVLALYLALMLFSLAWIGAYSMTDAALYDGRALLGFMCMLGLSMGLLRNNNQRLIQS